MALNDNPELQISNLNYIPGQKTNIGSMIMPIMQDYVQMLLVKKIKDCSQTL